ncbi:uncharacterized protein LOC111024825 [Momordica charantia]|uniref:Uncharacterized protein LOC111024825 n=1 Tax=Momordica charantia TaxID=3673 RepID=A0A6J1DVH8_MOMCH|nr:uncharacterized protein LOC111024825 [Momordica charantia]
MSNLLKKYNIRHKIATAYHPQTNGLVEVSNRAIKSIVEKSMNVNRKDWAIKLDDALWDYRIAYQNLLGEARLLQLHELDEFRQFSYEKAKMYKEQIKKWHDKKMMNKNLEPGD